MTRKQTTVITTRAEWADRIRTAHMESVEAIFNLGRLLIEAKRQLEYGDFTSMVERDLPFGPRTAQMLMAVAGDKRLTNEPRGSLLPASWRTLYELHRLSDEMFERAIAEGKIHADMERADAEQLQRTIKVVVRAGAEPSRTIVAEIRRNVEPSPVIVPKVDLTTRDIEERVEARQPPQRYEVTTPSPPRETEYSRQSVIEEAIAQSVRAMERIKMQGSITRQEVDAIRNHGITWLALAEQVEVASADDAITLQ